MVLSPFLYQTTRLTINTAPFAEGCIAVSLFVSDDASAQVLNNLNASGVQFIALLSAGFNNTDLKKVKELGMRVARGSGVFTLCSSGTYDSINAWVKPETGTGT